ncbi:MAG: hypothetical protein JKY80_09275 [Mariprofundaceae bacterium]|nr:hypothetical protein [Mariprofundaceae bacterium]
MKIFNWMKFWRNSSSVATPDDPLREFVYLDEVSLRSLLSSQVGEVKDSTSKQTSDTLGVDVGSTVSAGIPQVGRSELISRFQTSNSSTLQTSRKATVQSWFRDFYKIKNIRLIEPVPAADAVSNLEELAAIKETSKVIKSSDLTRGELVEFRVKLAPDPIFHLATMMSEFSGMAEDYPEMFSEKNALKALKEAQPVNKILQRLLAGLIPIRAEAIDYVVVEIDDVEHVVHRSVVSGLNLDEKQLEIVGVTEHLAYWKDIRRVLFSEAEFTILCRISRDALHNSWTPVKLADLFKNLVPGLVEQINSAGDSMFDDAQTENGTENSSEKIFLHALNVYKGAILRETGKELPEEQEEQVFQEIIAQRAKVISVSTQRDAFSVIKSRLEGIVGATVDATKDLELREAAREKAGLPLIPSLIQPAGIIDHPQLQEHGDTETCMLDVEIVAIYW